MRESEKTEKQTNETLQEKFITQHIQIRVHAPRRKHVETTLLQSRITNILQLHYLPTGASKGTPSPATQNASRKSLGDKNKEVMKGQNVPFCCEGK